MHNKHMGMDQYFSASVLYLLVFVMMTGNFPCCQARNVILHWTLIV